MRNVDNYRLRAEKNKTAKGNELAEGDFIYLQGGWGKDYDIAELIKAINVNRAEGRSRLMLAKVVEIVDVDDITEHLTEWLDREAPANKGGVASDDLPEDVNWYNLTEEERETLYLLVTIYRDAEGNYIAVDCEGYDYWRNVYLPVNIPAKISEYAEYWRNVKIGRRLLEEEKRHDEQAAKMREIRDRVNAKCKFPYLNPGSVEEIAANIEALISAYLPGVKCQYDVRQFDAWVDIPQSDEATEIAVGDLNRIIGQIEYTGETNSEGSDIRERVLSPWLPYAEIWLDML